MDSMAAAIIIYILGIVIGSIGFGAWMKPGKGIPFEPIDYILYTLIILLWPAILFCILALAIPFVLLYLPIKGLLKFGEWIGEWPDRRKEALENAEASKDKGAK